MRPLIQAHLNDKPRPLVRGEPGSPRADRRRGDEVPPQATAAGARLGRASCVRRSRAISASTSGAWSPARRSSRCGRASRSRALSAGPRSRKRSRTCSVVACVRRAVSDREVPAVAAWSSAASRASARAAWCRRPSASPAATAARFTRAVASTATCRRSSRSSRFSASSSPRCGSRSVARRRPRRTRT